LISSQLGAVNLFSLYLPSTIMSGLTDEEANALCRPSDGSTSDFLFQQTMYRIKDPKKTLPFYSEVLGMTLLVKLDFPEAKFTLYFMGYENPADVPQDPAARKVWAMSRKVRSIFRSQNFHKKIKCQFSGHRRAHPQLGHRERSRPELSHWQHGTTRFRSHRHHGAERRRCVRAIRKVWRGLREETQ
jgi:catechol 2,3-dioxygenase-like lactoylglutathione lyase family enzyme